MISAPNVPEPLADSVTLATGAPQPWAARTYAWRGGRTGHGRVPSRFFERFALVAVDVAAVNLAFFLAWFLRYRMELIVEVDPVNYVEHQTYVPLQVALAGVFVCILALRGLYRLPRAASALDDASTVLTASGLSLMVVFAGSAFARYPAESRLTLLFAWVLMTVLVVAGRGLFQWLLGLVRRQGLGVVRTLVVGENTLGRIVMQTLAAKPHLGYAVAGYLGSTGGNFGRFRCLGTPDELEHVVQEHRISQVIVALPNTSHEEIMRIVDHCRRDGVQFRVVPDLYEMSLGRVDLDTVSGVPLLGMKDASIRGFNLAVKRALDVLGALLLLAVLSPVFGLIALAIKLDDPSGPVLFGQTRVGRGGKQFTAWKFRSMRRGADEQLVELLDRNEVDGPIFKMRDDPRRTRVGRLLRRLSLDELPQLWNVLVGDMSLVGPRPPTPREVALYEEWHHQRLEAPPGITGLWQVSGRSELGFDEMVMLDITYIENWSLGLDLRILLRTLPAVISGKGAF